MVFHVLNRGVARMQLFEKAADYQAFEQVLQDTLDQSPMRICAYAVMPNHWHPTPITDSIDSSSISWSHNNLGRHFLEV